MNLEVLEFWILEFGLKKFAPNNGNVFDQL
jgi:hypothetical protein